ncbi:putative Phosphatidylinositol 4-kinase beta [Paratrimastix pyriformis]|uniref:Lysosomal dipeptide transporter MFSD1 n=1 Tax=Paratrimastix pyriformis TaxID=342808 RepID=A0ABQ8UUQ5_9EUKA|nr:putative Phosphatidylinositol 4-kinase beta [Paratrimastix pyriformis]
MRQTAQFLLFLLGVGVLLLPVGGYFGYESVSALSSTIIADLNITTAEYSLLFSFYSLPNIVLVFVGGISMDRLGLAFTTNFCSACVVIGAALVALGAQIRQFSVMLMGRLLFGIGSESIGMGQTPYLARYFTGSQYVLWMSAATTFCRVAAFGAYMLMAPMAQAMGVYTAALWACVAICAVPALANLGLIPLNRHLDKAAMSVGDKVASHKKCRISDLKVRPHPPGPLPPIPLRSIPLLIVRPPWALAAQELRPLYWICLVVVALFYSSYKVLSPAQLPVLSAPRRAMGMTSAAVKLIVSKWGFSEEQAGFASSLIFIFPIFLTIPLGAMISRYRLITPLVTAGTLLALVSTLLLVFTDLTPYLAMCLYGLGSTCFSGAIWPAIPLIVPENLVGSGTGLMYAVRNGAIALVVFVVGLISSAAGLEGGILFLCGCIAVTLALCGLLWYVDLTRMGGVLTWRRPLAAMPQPPSESGTPPTTSSTPSPSPAPSFGSPALSERAPLRPRMQQSAAPSAAPEIVAYDDPVAVRARPLGAGINNGDLPGTGAPTL